MQIIQNFLLPCTSGVSGGRGSLYSLGTYFEHSDTAMLTEYLVRQNCPISAS